MVDYVVHSDMLTRNERTATKMASNSKRGNKSETSNTTPVDIEATEDFENIALPGEDEEDEDTAMAEDTVIVENDDNLEELASFAGVALPGEANPVAETDITSDATVAEAESDMAKLDAEAESLLSGENARIVEAATTNTVVMLDPKDLPKDARILKMQFDILAEYEDEYETLVNELRVGSSGKDEKVAYHITTISEETDAPGYALVNKVAALTKQMAELQAAKEVADAELTAHVEAALIASGNGDLLTEEQIAEKKELIKAKYGEYKDQFAAVSVALKNYREHKNPEAGEIHQYITHIPSPTGKKVNAAATGGDKGGSRAVFVTEAAYENAKGEWVRAFRTVASTKPGEADKEFSNPTELANVLHKEFGTDLKPIPLKEELIAQWYIHQGTTVENTDRTKVAASVATFPFNFKTADGRFTSVNVRLTPRDFNASR